MPGKAQRSAISVSSSPTQVQYSLVYGLFNVLNLRGLSLHSWEDGGKSFRGALVGLILGALGCSVDSTLDGTGLIDGVKLDVIEGNVLGADIATVKLDVQT